MAVDDHVEQPPQQEADAVLCQLCVVVPAGDDRVDRVARRLAHGDQVALGGEDRELVGLQRAGLVVERHVVHRDEDVVVVVVELRPLPLRRGILDRQRVEAELLRDQREVVLLRRLEVEPDDAVAILEVVGDLRGVEVLVDALAVAVQPRADHNTDGTTARPPASRAARRNRAATQWAQPGRGDDDVSDRLRQAAACSAGLRVDRKREGRRRRPADRRADRPRHRDLLRRRLVAVADPEERQRREPQVVGEADHGVDGRDDDQPGRRARAPPSGRPRPSRSGRRHPGAGRQARSGRARDPPPATVNARRGRGSRRSTAEPTRRSPRRRRRTPRGSSRRRSRDRRASPPPRDAGPRARGRSESTRRSPAAPADIRPARPSTMRAAARHATAATRPGCRRSSSAPRRHR